jgi:hypothetical protein
MNRHHAGTTHRCTLLKARQFSVHVATSFGVIGPIRGLDKQVTYRLGNFLTMDLSATERIKDSKQGYYEAHALARENRIFSIKFYCSGQMYYATSFHYIVVSEKIHPMTST